MIARRDDLWCVRRWTRRAQLVALVVSSFLTVGCAPLAAPDASQLPVRPQVVEIDMHDHRYSFDDPDLQPGRAMFRVTNESQLEHDLALIRLPDEVESVDEWLDRNTNASGLRPVYLMGTRAPDGVAVFAAELPTGTYGMLCLTESEGGTPHYKQGMTAKLEVGSPRVAPGSPASRDRSPAN